MNKIALAAALSLIAAPATGSDGNWQVGNDQIHIVDKRIDVTTADGRSRLLQRVERAAAKLCRDRSFQDHCEMETLRQTAATRSSWGRALARALSERGTARIAAQ